MNFELECILGELGETREKLDKANAQLAEVRDRAATLGQALEAAKRAASPNNNHYYLDRALQALTVAQSELAEIILAAKGGDDDSGDLPLS